MVIVITITTVKVLCMFFVGHAHTASLGRVRGDINGEKNQCRDADRICVTFHVILNRIESYRETS